MNEATEGRGAVGAAMGKDGPGMEMFDTTRSTILRDAAAGGLGERRWTEFDAQYRKVLFRYGTRNLRYPEDVVNTAIQDTMVQLANTPRLIYRPPNKKFRYVLVVVFKHKLQNAFKKETRYQARQDPRLFKPLYETENDFKTEARRAIKAYLATDLILALVNHGLAELELSGSDVEAWQRHDTGESVREIARSRGVDKNTVSAAIARVDQYLEDECEALFVPLAR